jgi:hypothetical protein
MRVVAGVLALFFVGLSTASATVTISGANGTLAASAAFQKSGNNLIVTLTNTSTSDVLVPADVLTAVFFDIDGFAPTFTRTSAVLNTGSTVLYDGSPAGGVVGGEWAYNPSLTINSKTFGYGISSSGLGLFGPGDRFPGTNLAGPDSPDGPQYGIVSAGDNSATGNGGITGSEGLIKNSVVFTLQCTANCGFAESNISDIVRFQYGTNVSEPNITTTPEPGFYGLLSLGMTGLYCAVRRRRMA